MVVKVGWLFVIERFICGGVLRVIGVRDCDSGFDVGDVEVGYWVVIFVCLSVYGIFVVVGIVLFSSVFIGCKFVGGKWVNFFLSFDFWFFVVNKNCFNCDDWVNDDWVVKGVDIWGCFFVDVGIVGFCDVDDVVGGCFCLESDCVLFVRVGVDVVWLWGWFWWCYVINKLFVVGILI